jgi:hypothetical protein
MSDTDKDETARALERLTSGPSSGPTPQPRPRTAPTPQVRVNPAVARPAAQKPPAQKPVQKVARPAAPSSAPDQSLAAAVARARHATPKQKTQHAAPGLALRRTLIPVLLTGGFLLIGLAIIRFAWSSIDNPMLDLPRSVVIAMISLGVVCWVLAALNMFLVDRSLRKTQQEPH